MSKDKIEKIEKNILMEFMDGPRIGTMIRLINPPPKKIRLAFPEWTTYVLRDSGYFVENHT